VPAEIQSALNSTHGRDSLDNLTGELLEICLGRRLAMRQPHLACDAAENGAAQALASFVVARMVDLYGEINRISRRAQRWPASAKC
jgi:hypothetical protein